MEKKNSYYPSVLFVAIISSYILAYSILTPNWLSGINFFILLLLILLICLIPLKRLCLVKNCFQIKNNDYNVIFISILLISAWIFGNYVRTGSITPITEISGYTLFQTLTEEIVFRVAILGIFIEMIPLKQCQNGLLYWTENKNDSIKLLAIILLISILFSNLHVGWTLQDLITRSMRGTIYAFAFVLTDKKIYLPWILHYINNVYA